MNRPQLTPQAGCYRLGEGIRIVKQEKSTVAICDYPLRVIRLNTATAHFLTLCNQEHTCEQLAQIINMPIKKVEALCDQLRWKGLLEAGPTPAPAIWPGVSIIIPSYNRVWELKRCLLALFNLDYPTNSLEILVVDDGSTDETCVMLQAMIVEATKHQMVMRTIRHDKQQGVAISRNTGAAKAQYDLLAYIDSDCVASPSWLAELVPAFQDTRIGAVGGMIRAYERSTMLGRYEDVRSSLFMGQRPQQVQLGGPLTYLPTANLLIRRCIWEQLGGFAPLTFGEDVDFCRRLLATGACMDYLPRGIVYHDYRTTIGAFLRIRVAYASAEAALLQRHPTGRRILLLPPEQATFAGLALGSLWSIFWTHFYKRTIRREVHRRLWIFSLLSFLFIFVLTIFGVRVRMQKIRRQNVPIIPQTIIKATLRGHLAYTYHLCRHLTRYYLLPLLMLSLLIPPLLLFTFLLSSVVIGVDYVRLHPDMSLSTYALCSILDDCAYEVGVVQGCIKHKTWKPLFPVFKRQMKSISNKAASKEKSNL